MDNNVEKEVSETIGRFADAVRNQDLQALSSMIADEEKVVFYGSQSGDKEVGHDDILASFKEQFADTEAMDSEILSSVVSVSGDMAWGAYDLRYTEKGGGKAGTFDTRWTCVLRHFPDGWKLVHMHHSIGR
ncbi:MAG TPA: nuclear transport factor 2 family protein [Nitrospiria bacterium]